MKCVNFSKTIVVFLKLCLFGLFAGIGGGLISVAFSYSLSFATNLREASPWVVLLLPIGGIAIVALYRSFGMSEDYGTNALIESLKNNREINPLLAPLIGIATTITHLFGGSAGKEGAAIQLGGAAASGLSNVLRLKNEERSVFIMCGMGAMFAGMFGTPLAAAFFILEFKTDKKVLSLAVLPCFIAATAAKIVASFLGVAEKAFSLKNAIPFSFASIGKVLVLSLGIYLLGVSMCLIFDQAKKRAKRAVPNSFLRIVIGAVLIVIFTVCVGDMRYNGSGMSMAIMAIEGKADWFDFILKIVFTAVTLAAGLKGGEIVPTFCIGATFGCVLGSLLGLDAGLSAALGLVGLFCCATNSLVSAALLGIELFGVSALPPLLVVCLVLWLLPNHYGLFVNRVFQSPFSKKLKNT